jgi:hypothetical protein
MRHVRSVATYLVAVAALAGCAPAIIVENRTRTPVRAAVLQQVICGPGGCSTYLAFSTVLTPPPGQSSAIPALQGRYNVAVADEGAWVAYVKAKRDALLASLKNPGSMSPSQVRDVINKLGTTTKDFDSIAKARCYGEVGNNEEDVLVQISVASNGSSLIATCTKTAPKKNASR